MNDLDDRLRDVLLKVNHNLMRFGYADSMRIIEKSSAGQQMIDEIKQAFADAGWSAPYIGSDTFPVNPKYTPEQLKAISKEWSKPRMTGRMWLERFEKELPEMIPTREERERWYALYPDAKPWVADIRNRAIVETVEAARRASGADDD